MQKQLSLLRQEREKRGWSRAKVEALTEGRIPTSSLERWEEGKSWPRSDNIEELCKLYGKSAKELGLEKSGDIMTVGNDNAPTSQGETPMSDLVRREIFRNLGSRLTSLIDAWPKRNYRYAELQEGIKRAILGYNTIVAQEPSYEQTRRQAVKDLILVPIQLTGGIALISSGKVTKADTDLLLKHCAAGITALRYLRRGKELTFVSDVASTYIFLLQPLIYSNSENYRKASAELLAQSLGLKASITEHLKNSDQAIIYYSQAVDYAVISGNTTEQAIANRMMAFSYWRQGPKGYKEALSYAEKAYGLARSNKEIHRNVQSFTASGLSVCQAVNGKVEDAKISLAEARNLFDPTMPAPYTESNLLAISADICQHAGLWQESIDLLAKWLARSLIVPEVSVLTAIQGRIQYATTEVSRDDKPRDMGLCITLLNEAITGAEELGSEHYQHEARQCYSLFRAAWPREDAIKRLGKDHFGLN
jgi:tetratricopeptide (TPR) repeat protein